MIGGNIMISERFENVHTAAIRFYVDSPDITGELSEYDNWYRISKSQLNARRKGHR